MSAARKGVAVRKGARHEEAPRKRAGAKTSKYLRLRLDVPIEDDLAARLPAVRVSAALAARLERLRQAMAAAAPRGLGVSLSDALRVALEHGIDAATADAERRRRSA